MKLVVNLIYKRHRDVHPKFLGGNGDRMGSRKRREKVKKAAAVLQIPDVSLIGDGEEMWFCVRDKKNTGSNSYKINVGMTEHVFQFNMKVENLKLLC